MLGSNVSPGSLDEDLDAFGASADVVAACSQSENNDRFQMWPGCLPVLLVFLGLETQWRIGPSGVALGLNYHSAEIEINMQEIDSADRRALWFDLKTMERSALRAFDELAVPNVG